MTPYVIPRIANQEQFRKQLNTQLESIAAVLAQLTAGFLTDEMYVPLLTETGDALTVDA